MIFKMQFDLKNSNVGCTLELLILTHTKPQHYQYKGTIKGGIVDEGVNYEVVWIWLRRIFT